MKTCVSVLLLVSCQMLVAQAHSPHFGKVPWESIILGAPVSNSESCEELTQALPALTVGVYHVLDNTCYQSGTIGNYVSLLGDQVKHSTAINPALFEPAPQFRLVVHFRGTPNHTSCFRLFDITTQQPLPATEVCQFTPVGDDGPTVLDTGINFPFYRLVSGPASLPIEEHLYTVQSYELIVNVLPSDTTFGYSEVDWVKVIAEQ